jgi:hypothetical protein
LDEAERMATIAKRDGGETLDLDFELYPEAGRWVNLRSEPRLQNYILLTTAALRMKGPKSRTHRPIPEQ